MAPALGLGLRLELGQLAGGPLSAQSIDQTRYMFAMTRVHLPLSQSVPDNTQLSRHSVIAGVTPDYPVKNIRAVFVNWYMNKSGVGAQEQDTGNALTINGASIKMGGVWYPATFSGVSNATIADGGTLISDPIITAFVPARTALQCITIDSVTTGQFRPGGMNRQTGNGETQLNAATPDLTKLTSGSIASGNNAGTNNGLGYGPCVIIGQGWDGRDVVIWFGDSMAFPANDISNFAPASGVQGWIGRGLDDNSNGTKRHMGANFAVEGTAASSCSTRNAGEFRRRGQLFDAIRALNSGSEPPFTAIISEHINNDAGSTGGSTTTGLLAVLQTWWNFLHSEFPKAKIIQTAAFPNAQDVGNYRWTDETQQTTTTPNTRGAAAGNMRWGASDSYIANPPAPLTGVINQAPAVCGGTNNDRWKADPFSALVTTANTAAGTTVSVDTAVNIGDALVFEPANANFNGPTKALTVTGTGPYALGMFAGLSNVHAIGSAVKRSYTEDGVHASPATHRLILAPYITAAKQAGLLT